MADPTRWVDDPNAPAESVSLVRSLGGPKPYSEAAHARIAAKVSETVTNAPVTAAASKIAPLKVAGISGAIVAGIGAIALVVSLGRSEQPAPPRDPRQATTVPVAPATPPPQANRAAPEVAEPVPTAKPEERAPVNRSPRDDLAVEETLLEQARTAASPAKSLALLREHERRFPRGALAAERLFLSAKAQAESGNRTAARRYQAELERRFPASSYVPRLRVIVAERLPERRP
jgi:type IV secretory pathway VirB10-like protein